MTISYSLPGKQRRLYAIALTLAVHLALIYGWQLARRVPAPAWEEPHNAIVWQWLTPLPPPAPVPPHTAAPSPRQPKVRPAPAAAPPVAAAVPDPAPATPPIAPAPERSGRDMLEQARRDAGKIDRELRRAYPGQAITAPVQSPQTRLAKGIAAAADAAPNRWFEAPKVTEIIDPGGLGRRRYRVVGANGTYCITVESNHAPDGRDSVKNGIAQKTTNCEENEQSATRQKW